MGYHVRRKHELHRRRQRRRKIEKLRKKLAATVSKTERERLVEKIRTIRPFEPLPEK
jgi:hypothetical protein